MNSTPLPLFTVRAAVDSDGRIFNVSVWAELPTEDAAREVAARFPKSLRVVGSGLTCVRGRSVEERGLVSSSFYLTPNAVTGTVNESGLARLRRLMSRIEWRLDTESIANAADEASFRRLLA